MADEAANVIVSGFTDEQAHRLTGATLRQIRLWDTIGFFKPSLSLRDDGLQVELYSFRDLVCLKVLNALRNECGVSLQHLRQVKEELAHLGEDMWSKTTLHVFKKRVVIHNPETGELEEVLSKQGVLRIPLKIVTGDMLEAIRALRQRPESARGHIDARSVRNPMVAGTRIPVRTIKDLAAEGLSVREIVAQYPSLTEADVHAALGFELAA